MEVGRQILIAQRDIHTKWSRNIMEHYEQLYVDDIYGYTARHHQSPGHVISLDQSEASVEVT